MKKEELIEFLKEQEMTVSAFADAAGVARNTVSRFVNGKFDFRLDTEGKVLKAMKKIRKGELK